MTQPKAITRYTPQEYYRLEREAHYKSDFYEGEIFDMSGGTAAHSLICGNIVREMGNLLKGTPCATYESNLRLKVIATGLRTYPDASVYCDPPQQDPEDSAGQTMTNPTVLFEVLSKSTEAYDRGVKSESYRTIPSLAMYVLVSQTKPHLEVFEKTSAGDWLVRDLQGIDQTLKITTLRIELPLNEIYARVDFRSVAVTDQES